MRIKTALWGLLLAAWTTTAQAAIVYLTDGSRVEGTIVGATARDVQVHTAEGTLTISAEVAAARKLFERHDWPSIDVSRRSIEETAATVLNILAEREHQV